MQRDLTLDSALLNWEGLTLKGYHYASLDVEIPMMRDYMIVSYKGGEAQMCRRSGGPWESHRIGPGVVSVLTRAEESNWRWNAPIDVTHVYLSHDALASVAAEVFEQDIEDVELFDIVSTDDAVLTGVAAQLSQELNEGGLGGRLYVEALRIQTCVHILGKYANVVVRERCSYGGLSRTQCRLLTQFVEENIDRNISLADLAGLVQLSVFYFTRKFRAEFGCPPYAYVNRRRLEHAKRQLGRSNGPLKVVAASCGFADQSHMTRLFRRVFKVTPAEYRRGMLDT